jgi:hypothetical protein
MTQPVAKEALGKADIVLAIGVTADTEDLEIFHRETKARFLFIGFDSLDRIDPKAEIGIVENSRVALQEMLAIVGNRKKPWDTSISTMMKAQDQQLDAWVESYRNSRPIHFAIVLKELAPFLEPNVLCILDVGSHNILSGVFLPLYSKTEILAWDGFRAPWNDRCQITSARQESRWNHRRWVFFTFLLRFCDRCGAKRSNRHCYSERQPLWNDALSFTQEVWPIISLGYWSC